MVKICVGQGQDNDSKNYMLLLFGVFTYFNHEIDFEKKNDISKHSHL